MSQNTTAIPRYDPIGIYTAAAISFLSVIISTFTSLNIVIITYITPNLRSPTNLLVCNTCLCTVYYSIISTINVFILYLDPISTDWSCRIRGYLYYIALSLVIYSYVIQGISRLFWTVLYRYRYLLTNRCHTFLIIIEICLSIIIPLPSIITKDIVFRPFKLCLVAITNKIHIFYLLMIGYIIPLLTILILYGIIYRHIIRATSNIRQSQHGTKRDSELARNILILLGIFVFGGIPTVIFIIISSKIESVPTVLFLIAVTAPSISVAVEKIMTVVLNKDIRKALKQRWMGCFPRCLASSTAVQPFAGINTRTNRTVSEMFPMTIRGKQSII